jgi:hypothetical protein
MRRPWGNKFKKGNPMDHSTKLALIEAVQPGHRNGEPDIAPMADQVHDLLNKSIEQIAQNTIDEIEELKKTLADLGNQMLAAAAEAKDRIKRLHELNGQIAEEVRRGQKMRRSIGDSIEKIAG